MLFKGIQNLGLKSNFSIRCVLRTLSNIYRVVNMPLHISIQWVLTYPQIGRNATSRDKGWGWHNQGNPLEVKVLVTSFNSEVSFKDSITTLNCEICKNRFHNLFKNVTLSLPIQKKISFYSVSKFLSLNYKDAIIINFCHFSIIFLPSFHFPFLSFLWQWNTNHLEKLEPGPTNSDR